MTPTAEQQKNWEIVVDFLHYSGRHYDILTHTQKFEIRQLGNGYGDLRDADPCFGIVEMIWDWSHVRDSDAAAVGSMAEAIRRIMPAQIAIMYDRPTFLRAIS